MSVLPLILFKNDQSFLTSNDIVYSAAGNEQIVIELSMEELERYSDFIDWVDVSKEQINLIYNDISF